MPTFGYTKEDFISLGKGLGIAVLGAVLTYLTAYISGHDFGVWTPVVVVVWSAIVNFVRKGIDGPVEKSTGVQI